MELPVLGNPQKEILDVALRCSAKAQDKKSAKKLVQSSRGFVSTFRSFPFDSRMSEADALAASFPAIFGSVEGFWKCWYRRIGSNSQSGRRRAYWYVPLLFSLTSSRWTVIDGCLLFVLCTDAIIAIFHSIADRSLLLPYVRMVTQILQTWPKDEPRGASTQTFEYRAGLLETFNKILAWMNSDTSSLLDPVSSIEEQADWTVEALGLTKEHEALAIRVWQRIEKSKLVLINAKSGEGGELDTGRSVRTL